MDKIFKTSEKLPPKETDVLVCRNGAWHIGALFTEHPTYEDTYQAFDYWDDPTNEGRCWEWDEVTHWTYLLPLPEAIGAQENEERRKLIDKIQTLPHPVYGTANPRFYSRKKNRAAEMMVLTEEEKKKLWPLATWPTNRMVKMTRTQLQQALNGNFMLPGEEALRVELQLATLEQTTLITKRDL